MKDKSLSCAPLSSWRAGDLGAQVLAAEAVQRMAMSVVGDNGTIKDLQDTVDAINSAKGRPNVRQKLSLMDMRKKEREKEPGWPCQNVEVAFETHSPKRKTKCISMVL